MKCNQCGNVINPQDKFCKNCGVPCKIGTQNQVGTNTNVGVNSNPTVQPIQQGMGNGGLPPYNNMQVNSTPNYNSGYTYSSSKSMSSITIFGIIGFLLIGGFFLFFVIIPFISNKLGKEKQNFLSSEKQKSDNDLICTYRGDVIDTQITINYDGSKAEKVKYSFIYDTSHNSTGFSITDDGFSFSTNGEISIDPDDITVCDGDGNCEGGKEESMDEKSLELFMGFKMMSTSICNEKGVNCIDKKEGNYQKNAYEFTPSLITNRTVKESFVEDITDYSKSQVQSMLETQYGLSCK